MPPLPVLTAKQLLKILERHGFEQVRQRGSHISLRHSDGRHATVPKHTSKDLGKGLLHTIMRDAGLTPEDVRKR